MNPIDFFFFLTFYKISVAADPNLTFRSRQVVNDNQPLRDIVAGLGGFDALFTYGIYNSVNLNVIQLQIYLLMFWDYTDARFISLGEEYQQQRMASDLRDEKIDEIFKKVDRIDDAVTGIASKLREANNALEEITRILRQEVISRLDSSLSSLDSLIRQLGGLDGFVRNRLAAEVAARVTNAISSRIEAAVGELTRVIDAASEQLTTNITNALNQNLARLEALLNDSLQPLQATLDEVRALIEQVTNEFCTTLQELEASVRSFGDKLEETRAALEQSIDNSRDYLKGYADEKSERWLDDHWSPFTRKFDSFLRSFNEAASAFAAGFEGVSAILTDILANIVIIRGGVATALADLGAISGILGDWTLFYTSKWSKTYDNTVKILNKLNNLPDELVKKIEDKLDKIFDKLADEVALRIVGESHYKYDATSSFYPTITMIFKEINVNQYPRRTQVKLRSPRMTDEVTDEYVQELKDKASLLGGLGYKHGAIRAMFVSMDKRFKTQVIVSQKDEAISLFRKLLGFLGEPFDECNLM